MFPKQTAALQRALPRLFLEVTIFLKRVMLCVGRSTLQGKGLACWALDHFLSLLPKGCTIWARQMTYMAPTICTLCGSHHLYIGVMHTLF